MIELVEQLGDGNFIVISGIVVGLLFGMFAQQSQFCLRAATSEFWQFQLGSKLAIWLLAFSTAVLGTQWLMNHDYLTADSIRQINGVGSLSGAVVGGLLFGSGMILARGCASRLLVLSATGNLRALMTGLLLTVVAQASLKGILSPVRLEIASWWTISGQTRSLEQFLPSNIFTWGCILLSVLGFTISIRHKLSYLKMLCAVGVGITIGLGWYLTSIHASWAFEGGAVQSVSFTGPSADTLMALINAPTLPQTFGIALVPGVFFGSLLAASITRQFHIETFDNSSGMFRYIAGAIMMGFGSMLAGGCAVGAGMTGGSVLATTAWIALFSMWLGAGITERILQTKPFAKTDGQAHTVSNAAIRAH